MKICLLYSFLSGRFIPATDKKEQTTERKKHHVTLPHIPKPDTGHKPETPPRLALHFDYRDWLPYLEDEHSTEAQKRALIEQLSQVVVAFVDLGWTLNPTQQICGETLDLKAVLDTMALDSNLQAPTNHQDIAQEAIR